MVLSFDKTYFRFHILNKSEIILPLHILSMLWYFGVTVQVSDDSFSDTENSIKFLQQSVFYFAIDKYEYRQSEKINRINKKIERLLKT